MSPNVENVSPKREVDWFCVILNLQILVFCSCGIVIVIYDSCLVTTIFSFLLITFAMLGVTAGSHRLWSHQTFKASTSLKIFLMLSQTLTGHGTIYNWVRLHRLHHKYYQTDLDPLCPKKDFIHSHFICSNLKLTSEQEKCLEEIDLSDLENDAVVMFQKKHYWFLFLVITLLLPIIFPILYWGETVLNSVLIVGWIRFGTIYHLCLLIHSGSTIFDLSCIVDKKSFDDKWSSLFTKTYWISYHYLIPEDYQTSEYGSYATDYTTRFIKLCADWKLATDFKTVGSSAVRRAWKDDNRFGKFVDPTI